jgi:4-hydroxybenzoate polyprenyltransferase
MIRALYRYGSFVRCTGAEFTLPFAFAAMAVAARQNRGWPGWRTFLLILAGMTCAHAFALGFELIVARKFSVPGPTRTNGNCTAGNSPVGFALAMSLLGGAGLVLAGYFLNRLCFYLAPIALGLVCFSLLSNRFTNFTHLFRGFTVALAPVGAWLAVKGENLNATELVQLTVFTGALVLWAAGFDIVYSLPDYEFDRVRRTGSLAVAWGPANALAAAFIAHMLCSGLLLVFGLIAGFRIAHLTGWTIIVGCFVLEHWIARRRSLGWINSAFRRLNAVASTVFLVTTIAEVVFAGGFRLR